MSGLGVAARSGVLLVGAAVCASFGFWLGYAESAERGAAVESALVIWQQRFEEDRRKLNAQRDSTDAWLDGAAAQLSGMQAGIVLLDSLAARLVERTGLDGREFNFGAEPGMGGPEEVSIEHAVAPPQWEVLAGMLADQIEDRRRQMGILEDVLKWRDLRAAVVPDGRPVKAAYVSSPFGLRIDPFTGRQASHRGIDFAGPSGTEIVAVAAGIVTWSGVRSSYGKVVEIDHGDGLVTRYAHNSKNLVQVGDVVTRGRPIAELGATGRATGPNLHFEVLQDGEAVDPLRFIQ